MPYDTRWEDKGILVRYWGTVTKDDLMAQSLEHRQDPMLPSARYLIADFTSLEGHSVLPSDVLLLAAQDYHYPGHMPLAIVFKENEDALLDLARLYAQSPLLRGRPIKTFSELAEARAWITRIAGE